MYPRSRIDALTDGVFAVAMTLLVLDVRLPEEFHARDANELISALLGLSPKFVPYVLSFLVLGLRWLSSLQVRSRGEFFVREYVVWWLVYLLLITCVPFSTMVVGRFAGFAPAIWLYATNTILVAAVSFRLLALTPEI
jgi:TMEM175 potassium channel family protein